MFAQGWDGRVFFGRVGFLKMSLTSCSSVWNQVERSLGYNENSTEASSTFAMPATTEASRCFIWLFALAVTLPDTRFQLYPQELESLHYAAMVHLLFILMSSSDLQWLRRVFHTYDVSQTQLCTRNVNEQCTSAASVAPGP
jgi:hypothetical protein